MICPDCYENCYWSESDGKGGAFCPKGLQPREHDDPPSAQGRGRMDKATYTPMREEPIIPTRERCAACQRPSIVSFTARDDIWAAVVHPQFRNSILCLQCFASRADEKLIPWEMGIELFPRSLASQLKLHPFHRDHHGEG